MSFLYSLVNIFVVIDNATVTQSKSKPIQKHLPQKQIQHRQEFVQNSFAFDWLAKSRLCSSLFFSDLYLMINVHLYTATWGSDFFHRICKFVDLAAAHFKALVTYNRRDIALISWGSNTLVGTYLGNKT